MDDVPLREHIEALLGATERNLQAAITTTRRELEAVRKQLGALEKVVSNLEGRAVILAASAGVAGAVVGALVARLIAA